MRYDDPQPRDGIMARICDVNRPSYLNNLVSIHYYVFDAVRSFCHIRDEICEENYIISQRQI